MWILIIYIYAGMFAKGDSVALAQVGPFDTEQACKEAGNKGKPLVDSSTKEYKFICVRKT